MTFHENPIVGDLNSNQEQLEMDRAKKVIEDSLATNNCIDCGALLDFDMSGKYFTDKVIGTNGGLSMFQFDGKFYLTGDPGTVKKLKESGFTESATLGVPTERIADNLPYVKGFLQQNMSRFIAAQEAQDKKYSV